MDTYHPDKKLVSIVISAYNEADNIDELYRRLDDTIERLGCCDFELIFVNDGSTDETLAKLMSYHQKDERVKIVDFTRNFGHEIAMTAGMGYAKGDCVIFMDADLQNPPELITEMIAHWLSGTQVVLTRRTKNLDETPIRRFLNKIFYKILNMLSDIHITADTPDFRLIDRKYIEILKSMDERERMFRGLLRWIGFRNYKVIDFVAPHRFRGTSKYSTKLAFRLAIDSIIQFSIKPLRLITFLGVIAAFLSIMLGVYEFIQYFIAPPMEINRTTIILTVIFIGSVQLIVLGIIGEYIGRIHIESKGRPLYVCDFYSHEKSRSASMKSIPGKSGHGRRARKLAISRTGTH